MFGKQLLHELKQYLRRLWPYAIAVVVMSALARVIVVFDRNEVEATGLVAGIGLSIMVALGFLVRGFLHAYTSFSKNLTARTEKAEDGQSVEKWLLVQFLAFMIFIAVTALLFLVCVSVFAWNMVGQMFLSLKTEWPYFLEFLPFAAITSVTVYLMPIAHVVASRFGKHKKLSLSVAVIVLFLCFPAIVFEVQLLMHEPSTDMVGVWASVITLLVIFVAADIWTYLLTRRTLKTAVDDKQDGDE